MNIGIRPDTVHHIEGSDSVDATPNEIQKFREFVADGLRLLFLAFESRHSLPSNQ